MTFNQQMEVWRLQTEEALAAVLPKDDSTRYRTLIEAMRYSLLAGGKRIRPVLAFACADAFEKWWQGEGKHNLPEQKHYVPSDYVAKLAAIEMIHTYSLSTTICLVWMMMSCGEDDRLTIWWRRVAVLAGDILNAAYENLFEIACQAGQPGARCSHIVAN